MFLQGGDLNPGERHSRDTDTRDDGTVTLCTLRTATVLSHDCRADFGRPLTKKVMSHSRDGPGVTAPLRTNIVPLTGVWIPPLPLPPFRKVPDFPGIPLKSTAGIPQALQLKAFEASRAFPELSPPQYGWGRLFFQKSFRRGPLRAAHGIPSSTEGIFDNRVK